MKEKTYKAKWISAKAEAKYRSSEAAGWERATSTPPETIDVSTQFGSTRVYRWVGSGPPIVFLHGMGDSSVRWVPFAEALDGHDIYAIDIMGDVGMSKPDVGLTSYGDYATWLGETLVELDLDDACVVGHSLGGFVALCYATRSDKLSSVVVFDPVGVVDLNLITFMMRFGLIGMFARLAPASVGQWLARRFRYPLLADKEALRVQIRGQLGHPVKMPPLPNFTDEELASIEVPVSVVVGDESSLFDVHALIERINVNVKDGEARSLPDAGHALTLTHFDDCAAAIRSAISGRTV